MSKHGSSIGLRESALVFSASGSMKVLLPKYREDQKVNLGSELACALLIHLSDNPKALLKIHRAFQRQAEEVEHE